VTIAVWNLTNDAQAQISFAYPPSWNTYSSGNTYFLSSTTTPPVLEGDPGNELQLNTLQLNGATSTFNWLVGYYTGIIDLTKYPPIAYVNPVGIQFLIIEGAPGESSDNAVAYTTVDDQIVQITVSRFTTFSTVFMTLLSSITAP
jgi:hypothetical protein